jgi:hypothetical protein
MAQQPKEKAIMNLCETATGCNNSSREIQTGLTPLLTTLFMFLRKSKMNCKQFFGVV